MSTEDGRVRLTKHFESVVYRGGGGAQGALLYIRIPSDPRTAFWGVRQCQQLSMETMLRQFNGDVPADWRPGDFAVEYV